MNLQPSIRFKSEGPPVNNINHYQGMVDLRIPERTLTEQVRDKWANNSYYHNFIVTVPLAIAKYLMVNDALEERIIRQTAKFKDGLRPDAFIEGMILEFNHAPSSTDLAIRFLLAIPEADNRWSMKQTFNFTLPHMDQQAREDTASLIIDVFTSRRFLSHSQYDWFKGTGFNVHTHSRSSHDTVRESIVDLLAEDCQISLQRFPMLLKPTNPSGGFAKKHGSAEAWSLNTISRSHQERMEKSL